MAALIQTSVTVHAYDITVEANVLNTTTGDEVTNIHMWCLDKESNPCLIRIDNFPVFCNVQLPVYVGDAPFEWNSESVNSFLKYISTRLEEKSPTTFQFHYSSPIYFDYGDRKSPFVRLFFKNLDHMYALSNLLKDPIRIYAIVAIPMLFNVCETHISIVRKMMTERDCQFSQWFTIDGIEIPPDSEYRIQVPGPKDRPLKEIVAQWNSLTPIPHSETASWNTKPRVIAFDIETYSNNHKAMPVAYNPLHCTNIITCVYQVKGDISSRKKYAFVFGDCPNDIPDSTVICCSNEDELLEGMAQLVRLYCPEIIIGYNIITYDYAYLDTRLKTRMKSWPEMGRIKNRRPVMNIKEWHSNAYGHNKLCILNADGIITIDMLPLIRRDYKLDKYDLDFVSKHFVGRGKHDVKFTKMFQGHEQTMFARKMINKASREISEDIPELIEEFSDRTAHSYTDAIKIRLEYMERGLEIGKLTESHIKRVQKALKRFGMAREQLRAFVAYGLEDATLCIDLFDKLNIWEGLIQLSNVVGVTITELFTRGQQVRCLSQVYHTAHKMGFVLNKRFANKLFFNGGFVFEPVTGLHENIICLDFASLYPSIMQAYNICFSTLVPPERMSRVDEDYAATISFDQDEPADGKPKKKKGASEEGGNDFFDDNDVEVEAEVEADEEEGDGEPEKVEEGKTDKRKKKKEVATVRKHYDFKWVKRSVREGVLPRIVRELVAERNVVRKKFMKAIEQKLEILEEAIPYIDMGIKDELTIAQLVEMIQNKLKLAREEHEACEEGTNKKALMMGIEDIEVAFKFVSQATDDTVISLSNRVNKDIADYKLQLVVLDKRQNALKVSANSMFGFLGAQDGGVMPLIEGAMSITAIGRILINMVNKYLKDKYSARIIYNDTDSVMVDLGIKDPKESYARGVALSLEISGKEAKLDKEGNILEPAVAGLFPPPLKMEFEKAMRIICFRKKMYAALLIDKDGSFNRDKKTGKLYILKRGIVLARRDRCKFLLKIYQQLLEAVLEHKPVTEGYGILMKAMIQLLKGEIPPRGNLTIIRELGSAYKSDNYFMKLYSEELRKMGRPPNPGDRLEYVIAKTALENADPKAKVKLGHKMRDINMYEEAWEIEKARIEGRVIKDSEEVNPDDIFDEEFDDPLKIPELATTIYPAEEIDYMYYIDHMLKAPLDQLFSVGYSKEIACLKDETFKPQFSRLHPIAITTPIAMLVKMYTDYSRGGYSKERIVQTIDLLTPWFGSQIARKSLI